MPLPAKVVIKIELISRLRAASQYSDDEIALRVGLTRSGLSRILALPEYKLREAEVLNTATESYDKALASNGEALRRRFEVSVPIAMRGLLEAAQQTQDLKTRVTACMELLDRDHKGTFAKLPRVDNYNNPAYANSQLPQKVLESTIRDADATVEAVAIPNTPRRLRDEDSDANLGSVRGATTSQPVTLQPESSPASSCKGSQSVVAPAEARSGGAPEGREHASTRVVQREAHHIDYSNLTIN